MQGGSTLKQRLKGVRGHQALERLHRLHPFLFLRLSLPPPPPLRVLGHCHFLFPYRALRTIFAECFNFTINNHQNKKKVITSPCIVIHNMRKSYYST